MKVGGVPVAKIDPTLGEDIKKLRQRAPKYLRSVIEDTYNLVEIESLANLEPKQVTVLNGGSKAANYLIKLDNRYLVIKFDRRIQQGNNRSHDPGRTADA